MRSRASTDGRGCGLRSTASTRTVASGSLREQFSTFFLGGFPRLKQKEIITAPTDRFRLQTEPAGEVLLKLSVMPKDFARYGVLC